MSAHSEASAPAPGAPLGAPAPGRRSALAALGLVVLLSAATLSWLHSANPSLYGYDGYFHIRYAEILRSQGISRTFPWWDETFLKDRYADKDFLYHVLLIPFTFGDLIHGAKLAAIVFGAAAVGIFYVSARALAVPWPAAWACGLLACSTAFLYRLGFTRPSLAAVSLAVAGTAAILSGRKRWAFALAAVYPHLHISYHLLPCIALLHDLQRPGPEGERRSLVLTRWTTAGAVAGAVISPYFPGNLILWWVQNIRVLGLAWTGPEEMGMGLEIRAGLSSQLLTYNLGAFLALGLAVYLLARRQGRPSPESMTLLVISGGFLLLSMMSRRFIEFWTPFTVLLAGVAARDTLREKEGRQAGRPFLKAALTAGAAVILGALLSHNARSAREIIREDPGATYREAADWLSRNVEPGEKIFHLDWDDFPQLFFFAPQFRYLVGLDPAFMYVTSPRRWRLWQETTHGETEDLYGRVRHDFGSRWVFGIHDAGEFLRLARRDPRFFPRYEDMNVTIIFLADGFRFVDRWELTGWYPNLARRLFTARLPGEPGFAPADVGPVARGPSAGGRERGFDAGFVDLTRALAVPPGVRGACAVARAVVAPPGPGPATVGITTDDEFVLYLDGRRIDGHSPLLSPPPGSPAGPPVSLDDLWKLPKRLEERLTEVELEGGSAELVVKSCEAGEDFGFYLRVFTEDGTNLPAADPMRGS